MLREVQVDVGLDLGRQLLEDLLLGPAQHEGARAPDDLLDLALVDVVEQPRHREVEDRDEFAEVVLHRRAGHRQLEARLQLPDGAGGVGGDVLHGLRLVEDDHVEGDLLQPREVAPDQAVGREHDVGVPEVGGALRAGVGGDRQPREELADLALPVEEQARGDHDQVRPPAAAARGAHQAFLDAAEQDDRLQRLAEAHVVGEAGAEAVLVEEGQPVPALPLIGAQRRPQPGGERPLLEPLEVQQAIDDRLVLRGQAARRRRAAAGGSSRGCAAGGPRTISRLPPFFAALAPRTPPSRASTSRDAASTTLSWPSISTVPPPLRIRFMSRAPSTRPSQRISGRISNQSIPSVRCASKLNSQTAPRTGRPLLAQLDPRRVERLEQRREPGLERCGRHAHQVEVGHLAEDLPAENGEGDPVEVEFPAQLDGRRNPARAVEDQGAASFCGTRRGWPAAGPALRGAGGAGRWPRGAPPARWPPAPPWSSARRASR